MSTPNDKLSLPKTAEKNFSQSPPPSPRVSDKYQAEAHSAAAAAPNRAPLVWKAPCMTAPIHTGLRIDLDGVSVVEENLKLARNSKFKNTTSSGGAAVGTTIVVRAKK